MGLTDLFRPKWKHSDTSVRSTAVRSLDAEETSLLAEIIATDRDDGVRRLAIKKIADPEILTNLAKEKLEGAQQQLALQRAASLWALVAMQDDNAPRAEAALAQLSDEKNLSEVAKQARLEHVRQAALERLTDPKLLAEVARLAKEQTTRLAALNQIQEQEVLRGLALDEQHREIALAAVEKITESSALKILSMRAKIKAVRARAKRKLASSQPSNANAQIQSLEYKQLDARLNQLLQTMERLALTSDCLKAELRFQDAKNQWNELIAASSSEHEELGNRFEVSCTKFATRLEQQRQKNAAQTKQVEDLQRDLEARERICSQIEALKGPDTPDHLAELEKQWKQLGPVPNTTREQIENRFNTACRFCQQRQNEFEKRQESRSQFEKLLELAKSALEQKNLQFAHPKFAALQSQWKHLADTHRVDEDLSNLFAELAQKLATREAEQKEKDERRKTNNLKKLQTICQKLEELVQSNNLRTIERHLKEAKIAFTKPGPLPNKESWQQLRVQHQKAQKLLFTRLQELRETDEWKRWSNIPKQEELCCRVEELLKSPDLKDVAQKLRTAQAEWKETGPASRDKAKELWNRFKEASDKVYARCEEYFVKLEEERKENLNRKQVLCEQAEELANSTNWKETTEKIKDLRNQWKAIGPVPHKNSNAIWKRFRGACDRFFDQRKEHFQQLDTEYEKNLKEKEALCEQVEALIDSKDWEETSAKIKKLQSDWKQIGPAPRKNSAAIWARFRESCDRFFDRRKAHLDEGKSANLVRKQELCAKLEQLAEQSPDQMAPDAVAQASLDVWKKWKSVGPIPDDEIDRLQGRLENALKQIMEPHPDAFSNSELDPSVNTKKKSKLCARAEELLHLAISQRDVVYVDEPQGESEDNVESMVERLREALSSNTFREESQNATHLQIMEEVESLKKNWHRTGPVPGAEGTDLGKRFQKACADALKATKNA
ncbi:MAG: DUF349 domain-containing protein [Pseudomonadota bacterium]